VGVQLLGIRFWQDTKSVESGDVWMSSQMLAVGPDRIAVRRAGHDRADGVQVVWGHGWGQSGSALLPLAESMGGFACSSVIDFPGFGNSPPPPDSWGTAEYADAMAEWLGSETSRSRFWVGHSFGGRVGIQLAARHPGLLSGLVLVASAGIPRKRSLFDKLRIVLRRSSFKTAKFILGEGPLLERLRNRLGSADYLNAGSLRRIFTRVVNEDLSEVAAHIGCPVLLVYADQDTETPPEIGARLNRIIPGSQLILLHGFDHHTILTAGRHQLVRHILEFMKGNER
jgi:pimeloyl-ACP methyl ester carboxylesterase